VPEAIAAYQKALQLKPSFVSARYNLALAYLQDGKTDDAIAVLKQYLDQERADPNAWAALAEAYRRKGMTAEAQDATQRAEALQPRR
jgi:predicted Zn-dependent protease